MSRFAFILIFLFAAMVTNAVVSVAAAVPLISYHERIGRAVAACETLVSEEEDLGLPTPTRDTALRNIREALSPVLMEVEANNQTWQVDNTWLVKALDEFEKGALSRPEEENLAAIERIGERLQSIDRSLTEFEQAASDARKNSTKEEDQARLAAILQRFENQEQEQGETALARLGQRIKKLLLKFIEWLRDLFPSPPRLQPGTGNSSRVLAYVIQITIYVLALGLLIFLIWRLWPTLMAYFKNRKAARAKQQGARIVLGEKIAAHQSANDLLSEAESLARAGELRAAIRKAYIAFLCELADRRQIQLADHLTNRDYLRAVKEKRKLYTEMQPLTNSFEKHWYGATPPTADDWTHFRTRYRAALGAS